MLKFTIETLPTTYGRTMFLTKERILELCSEGIALTPIFEYSNPNFLDLKDGEKSFVRYSTGNFKHIITYAGLNRESCKSATIYGALSDKTVLKYKKLHALHCKWHEILNVYRSSGIISKAVARKHAKQIRAIYGDEFYNNEIALNDLLRIESSYICKYSKCPVCKARMEEHIAGFSCRGKAQHIFDTYHGEWWHEMKDEVAGVDERRENQEP